MRRAKVVFVLAVAVAAVAAMAMTGCSQKTPEEKVARARAGYTARVNSFYTQPAEPEMAEAEMADDSMAMDGEAEGDAGDGMDEMAEMPMEEMAPPEQNVFLDLIVQHDLDDALPGITLDVSMVDAEEKEKGHWLVWVETAGLPEANQKQMTHVLEGSGYEDGDGFAVEVRSGIPAEELGDYAEFGG